MTLGIPELIALILGTSGLAGTITSIVQARRAIREGARTDERGVLADSERWRRTADDARRRAERDRDWWRQRAVDLWLACVRHGGDPPELGSPPPQDERPDRTGRP